MLELVSSLVHDVRETVRGLRRDVNFTVVAAIVLGLGIGATTAAYAALRVIVLDPLPYPDSGRLMMIWSRWPTKGVERMATTGADFRTYQREAGSFEGIAAVGSLIQNLTGGARPEQVTVGWVSRNFLSVMGVRPALGRDFTATEPSTSVLLGHGAWTRDFAADPDVIGRSVQLNGRPFTVVGVLPAGFRLHLAPDAGIATTIDVWRPPDEVGSPDRWVTPDIQSSQLRIIGRLKPGATPSQAREGLERIAAELRGRYPDHAALGYEVSVDPLIREVTGDVRPFLVLFQAAALLVLLLACANVANLFLVRSQRRRSEHRTRLTLGARRLRLLRLLLVEGVAVGALAGIVGLALAAGILAGVRALHLTGIPRLDELALGAPSLRIVAPAALLAGVLSATGAAVSASRTRLGEGLGVRGAGSTSVRRGLVVLEVALATLLLAGTSILVRSAWKLSHVDAGFETGNLLTFGVNLPGTRYSAPVETAQFLARLEDALRQRPGIQSAGSTWPLPLEGQLWAGNYRTAATPSDDDAPFADFRLASPGLLEAMGMQLVEGRNLGAGDTLAVLVNEQLATDNWPGRSAVGQSLELEGDPRALTVVGVVADLDHPRLRTYAAETIYLPMAHSSWTDWEIFVTVRTAGNPLSLTGSVREVVATLDPELPIGKIRPMRGYLADRLAPNRLSGWTTGGFAAAGLLLSMVGLFGVISYTIQARRRELAIRMTLGADPGSVRSLVLRSGGTLVGLGIVLGLAGALALSGLLSTLLYGVGPHDPLALTTAVLTAGVVGLTATWIPSWRASRANPADILRR